MNEGTEDETTIVFRKVAYNYYREHFDSLKENGNLPQIFVGEDFDTYSDRTIAGLITHQLAINFVWFASFVPEMPLKNESERTATLLMTELAKMFDRAYLSDRGK